VPVFERYVERVQTYLRGDEVGPGDESLPAIGPSLPLAQRPAARVGWLAGSAKVPVDVVGTGPRVLGVAGRLADRVTVSVGADPARVAWALGVARDARARAGLDPARLSFGAYVNVVAHPDAGLAREVARPGAVSFARFSAMHGPVVGPAADADRRVLEGIAPAYDMTRHFRRQAADDVPDAFLHRFAVVGPPAACAERLAALVALGLDRLVIVGGSPDGDRATTAATGACFLEEVAPALRAG
jgi:5,10-methylenetetrahydromethanopterin reductase